MLLIRIYHLLASGIPYREKHAPPLGKSQKARMIRRHIRRLGKLGIAVYSSRPGVQVELPKRNRPRDIFGSTDSAPHPAHYKSITRH
jgi:hypothetical protein